MGSVVIPKKKIYNPDRVIWQPQPRQAAFMARAEYEALYGGAAGGGKSDALLAEGLRQVHIPHYRGIIFRKTFPDAAELVDRSHDIYPRAYPSARYNDNKHFWRFSSGAKIYFGSMQYKKDRTKYQGKRYDYIAFDELTHFTYDEYSYMFSRNRPGGPGTRVYIRAATNPGGVGHGWVKERFIAGKEPNRRYVEDLNIAGQIYKRDRVFIPSSIFDNKILLENDPNYIANLGMLPEAELKALLYGDWESFQGQVFTEWKNDAEHYNDMRWTHVVKPFKIPKEWTRYRSFDFGYARPFSVGWWAVDYDGRAYRYRELYGSTGQPDIGVKWHPGKIAQEIRKIEDKYEKGNHIRGIADPSIWDASRGESIAETMERERIYFEKADNDRISGKMQFHYRLAFESDGKPMAYIFENCKDFIRTIPNLPYSERDVEDVDTEGEDHIYDESRYFFQMNPIAPRRNVLSKVPKYNPLQIEEPRDLYGFIRL
jgi:hypothetical protein